MNRGFRKSMTAVAFLMAIVTFTGTAAATIVVENPTVGTPDLVGNTSSNAYEIPESIPSGSISETYKANINDPYGSFVDQDWFEITSVSVGDEMSMYLNSNPYNAFVEMWGYDGSHNFMGRISKHLGNLGPNSLVSTPFYTKLTRGNSNTNAYYGYTFMVGRNI